MTIIGLLYSHCLLLLLLACEKVALHELEQERKVWFLGRNLKVLLLGSVVVLQHQLLILLLEKLANLALIII